MSLGSMLHFVFLTIPSSGEFNVQLTTAQHLLNQGHRTTFLSGESFAKHVDRFKSAQASKDACLRISFESLGTCRSVEDFTPTVRKLLPKMRRRPGNPKSIQTCVKIAHVSNKEHTETSRLVKQKIETLDPHMIIVDVLSPVMITGVRLTGRTFFLTIPCSPGLTALSGLAEPHAVATNRSGSIMTVMENMYLWLRDVSFCMQVPSQLSKWWLLKHELGLKSFGMLQDLSLLPPYWEDPNCLGGIHFNVGSLTDCPKQSSSLVFVGAGIDDTDTSKLTVADPELKQWMDEALKFNERVVYINMGSMFVWDSEEFLSFIKALKVVYNRLDGNVRFLFKAPCDATANAGLEEKALPPYIRISSWVKDQHEIYRHPALKAFVHHGGGNSFNEAVYYGVPQLIISQWLDTHEFASLVERFKLGLQSCCPPRIKSKDVQMKLLELLGPRWHEMKAASMSWSIRSKLGGGPSAAAKILISHAVTHTSASNSLSSSRVPSIFAADTSLKSSSSSITWESQL